MKKDYHPSHNDYQLKFKLMRNQHTAITDVHVSLFLFPSLSFFLTVRADNVSVLIPAARKIEFESYK